jgi:hypothetical protein
MSGITPFDMMQIKKMNLEKTFEEYLNEANKIISEVSKENGKALLYGSVGIYHYVKDIPLAVEFMKLYRRHGIQDINILVRRDSREIFKRVIVSLDYVPYIHLERTMGDFAGMFFKEETVVKVYYWDVMHFNHDIPVDWNSNFVMTSTDLLLSKLQKHYITDKDLSDISALLLKFDNFDEKLIKVTSEDWGLWRDALDNIVKLRDFINKIVMDKIKSRDELKPIILRSLKIQDLLIKSPKSEKWKPLPEDEKYWRDF